MSLFDPTKECDITRVFTADKQDFYIGARPLNYGLLPESIGTVVALSKDLPGVSWRPKLQVLHVYFPDSWDDRDLPSLRDLERWTDAMHALVRRGKDVLVHCDAGMNRSGLIMAVYLARFHFGRFSCAEDVLVQLRSARSPLVQNRHFEGLIKDIYFLTSQENAT